MASYGLDIAKHLLEIADSSEYANLGVTVPSSLADMELAEANEDPDCCMLALDDIYFKWAFGTPENQRAQIVMQAMEFACPVRSDFPDSPAASLRGPEAIYCSPTSNRRQTPGICSWLAWLEGERVTAETRRAEWRMRLEMCSLRICSSSYSFWS